MKLHNLNLTALNTTLVIKSRKDHEGHRLDPLVIFRCPFTTCTLRLWSWWAWAPPKGHFGYVSVYPSPNH